MKDLNQFLNLISYKISALLLHDTPRKEIIFPELEPLFICEQPRGIYVAFLRIGNLVISIFNDHDIRPLIPQLSLDKRGYPKHHIADYMTWYFQASYRFAKHRLTK